VTVGGAWIREREHGSFTLAGPAAFVAAMAAMIVLNRALTGR
jgi:hypothetical protein